MRLELIPALLILASLLQPAVCEDCSGQVVGEARYPAPTLEVREISGLPIPFQNGLPYPSLERQPSRLYIDLGGEWEAFYDENASQGLTLSPRDPATLALLEERMREVLGLEGWEPVRVPSCNNVRGGRWEAYQGVVWYSRSFQVPASMRGRMVRLVFQGSNYFTDVWVNGQYIGYHEGGFTPFVFDVTPHLRYGGENTIVVRVDNVPWSTTKAVVPYAKCDWWNYGGLYREVYLEAVDTLNIARVDVLPLSAGGAEACIEVRVVVHNYGSRKRSFSLRVQVFETRVRVENMLSPEPAAIADLDRPLLPEEACRELEVGPGGVVVSAFNIVAGMRAWSPSRPALYVARARLVEEGALVDEFYTQFGVRVVEVKGCRLTLNGEEVFLKGVARHEDYPEKGRALSIADIYRDLLIIKEMNANWVRTAHYPNHLYTYILTDRLGLLVWEEIPVYWFDGEAFEIQAERRIAEQMLLEMIYRDYNRPSIIVWGLANECSSRSERIRYLRRQAELARIVDPTRLVAQAARWDLDDDTWLEAGLDLIGVNAYFGVFYGDLEDLDSQLDLLHERFPEAPILVTEFGLWSEGVGEDAQAEYFKRAWKVMCGKPYLAGACWWTAFDYDSMRVFNTFGAVSWDRLHRKRVFQAIREAYALSYRTRTQYPPHYALSLALLLALAGLALAIALILVRSGRVLGRVPACL